jgi:pimeloyl-ACP methyl ester carboxylesterase
MRVSRTGMLVIGMATMFGAVPATAVAAGEDSEAKCGDVSFDVTVSALPGTQRMAGTICRPKHDQEKTLQILIHGASYNRQYWDFPFQPSRYSYTRAANDAGFTTIAVDRLGTGDSVRPPGELLTVHEHASTLHQIVTSIRNGTARDARGKKIKFDRIVLVGHSFGSNISWTEAGLYGDVDGLILTAISHDQNPPAAPLTVTLSWPAELDPKFASANIPSGYLTTIPGARDELFFHPPGRSPDVVAVDEQVTKDTLPIGMLFDQFTTYGYTQNIHVPVLNVNGDFDTLACQLPSCTGSGSIANEGSFYHPDADYTQLIVPETGHATNLHFNSRAWFQQAQDWVEDHVGSDDDHRGRGRRHR